jgi:hypothetical protein
MNYTLKVCCKGYTILQGDASPFLSMEGVEGTKDCPEIVGWVDISLSKSEYKLPSDEDMLLEADVEKMLIVSKDPRDKASIVLLGESRARVGEICSLD